MLLALQEFLAIRNYLPVVDARSESEFRAGHIPGAINLPLLNDSERVAVGITYKKQGRDEAIRLGFRLVGPRLEQLVSEGISVAGERKKLLVYCWRGGMRSSNLAGFVRMAGVNTSTLEGGYKTYRRAALECFAAPLPLIVLGGMTGTGKTDILQALAAAGEQVIDLEKLANHKGSAFGGLMKGPQPTTEQFQNELFEQILKIDRSRPVWIEDESIAIGKIFLPDALFVQKKNAPVIEVILPRDRRIDRLVNEYGPADKEEFLASMIKITTKLGGQNFNAAKELLFAGDMHGTIDILLSYYDKNYGNSLQRKQDQILDRLSWDGIRPDELVADLIAASRRYSERIGIC